MSLTAQTSPWLWLRSEPAPLGRVPDLGEAGAGGAQGGPWLCWGPGEVAGSALQRTGVMSVCFYSAFL